MTKQNKSPGIERRYFQVGELRADTGDDDHGSRISGHAAVFNRESDDLGGFREIVAPGAFTKTLRSADVRALFNHDPNMILGRNKAGTLRMSEDATGLAIEIDPPDTQAARDLLTSIGRGDVDQMSFGFRTIEDKWETRDGMEVRTLVEVELFDVSPVTYPAYPDTDVAVRSLKTRQEDLKASTEAELAAINTSSQSRARNLDLAENEI